MTTTATHIKKTATRKPAQTIEEKKARAEALHESIANQVEQLRDSARLTAFLDFAQAFHSYSINNLLLILSQREDASRVAGFRKWQGLNRQVRKGEKGIRIFGYSTKKVTEEDENGDEVEKRIARFPILSVFDIGQTELIDPEQGDPGTITAQLTGGDDFGIVDALSAYLTEEGWTVERSSLPGTMNGVTRPETMTIVIDESLSPTPAPPPAPSMTPTLTSRMWHGGRIGRTCSTRCSVAGSETGKASALETSPGKSVYRSFGLRAGILEHGWRLDFISAAPSMSN